MNPDKANSREIWISPVGPARTSGATTGSPETPYRCPTPVSLEAVLNEHVIPDHSVIHFMPGTFTTAKQIIPVAGWKLRGSGIDSTVIKIAPNQTPGQTLAIAVGGNYWGYIATDGVEISDLTVDCNLHNQTNCCVGAVSLSGNNTKISRVHAINWGTQNQFECFVLGINAHPNNGPKVNCVVDDCIIDTPAPTVHSSSVGTGGIFLNSGLVVDNYTNWQNGINYASEVRNCCVSNVATGLGGVGSPSIFNAYGVTRGVTVRSNRAYNITGTYGVGLYCEGSQDNGFDNILFKDNKFENVRLCSYFRTLRGNMNGIKLIGNTLKPCDDGYGIFYQGDVGTTARYWTIKDNLIEQFGIGTNTTALHLDGDFRASVLNNLFQGSGTGNNMERRATAGCDNFDGNYSLFGPLSYESFKLL